MDTENKVPNAAEEPSPWATSKPEDYKETFKVRGRHLLPWPTSHARRTATFIRQRVHGVRLFITYAWTCWLMSYRSPCAAASKASMDCLNRHNYDRDKCLDFFQAYRDCKGAWVRIYVSL
jgi:cytochrome c oxidase assembly protein subunit 23